MMRADLDKDLSNHGLVTMGAVHDQKDTLLLIGMGPGAWDVFTDSAEYADGMPDPLDRWSKRIIGACADRCGATETEFPSDGPPYPPFIQWALDSRRFWQSPVGMLVHDTFGLMISLRGALRLNGDWSDSAPQAERPCNTCDTRPCLSACPVGALSDVAPYDVTGCKSHLNSAQGAPCVTGGCLARLACPVSQVHPRPAGQSAFHMRAFVGSQ